MSGGVPTAHSEASGPPPPTRRVSIRELCSSLAPPPNAQDNRELVAQSQSTISTADFGRAQERRQLDDVMLRGRFLNRQLAVGYGVPEGFGNALLESGMTDEEWMQLQWELMAQEEEEEKRAIAESLAEAEARVRARAQGSNTTRGHEPHDLIDLTGSDDGQAEDPIVQGTTDQPAPQTSTSQGMTDVQPVRADGDGGRGSHAIINDNSDQSCADDPSLDQSTPAPSTSIPSVHEDVSTQLPNIRDQGVQTDSTGHGDAVNSEPKRTLDDDEDDEDGPAKRLRRDTTTNDVPGCSGSAPPVQPTEAAHARVDPEEGDFIVVPRPIPAPAAVNIGAEEDLDDEFILVPRQNGARSVSTTPTLLGEDD